MFKGLMAVFTTKVLFNPFVFAGIFYAIYLYKNFSFADIFYKYQQTTIYAVVLIASFLYNIFIKKHLNAGAKGIDWKETIIASIGSFFRFFIAAFLTNSFINFLFF